MKSLIAALVLVLVVASSASAGWAYVGPAPVVYGYWPSVAPVYSYPYAAPYVVARPVYEPAPVYYGPAPVVYGYPYAVPARVFVPGQPVRNLLRATLP
jgi:hypothetical protein